MTAERTAEDLVDQVVYGRPKPRRISEWLGRLGFRGEPNFVLCAGLTGYGALGPSAQDKARARAESVAARSFPGAVVAFLHQNCCYAIGRIRGDEAAIRRELAARAARFVASLRPLRAVAGISTVPEGVRNLGNRARNAVVAHRYDLLYPRRSVFLVEDLDRAKVPAALDLRAREPELAAAVRLGDVRRARGLAEALARDIAVAHVSFLDALRFDLLTVVFGAARAALDAGVEPGRLVSSDALCLRAIARLHDLRDLMHATAGAVADLASLAGDARRRKRSPAVAAAKEYMQTRYAEPIALVDLARHVHASAFHFSRTFKAEEGVSFVEFLNRIRVEKARSLLADPDRRVTDVCFDAGFGNLNHFTRTFARFSGCTPSAFRRKIGIVREA